ncbi:MAG TPA: hypothetical protein VGY91_10300 [Chthoniobacterales bacterium]|jgi:hypothetical protein|nr:hypothetical protein [Chthoniobacterales bacterium]
MNRNERFLNSSFQKAAEFSGAAGECRWQSLRSSQILTEVNATASLQLRIWDECRLGPSFRELELPLNNGQL